MQHWAKGKTWKVGFINEIYKPQIALLPRNIYHLSFYYILNKVSHFWLVNDKCLNRFFTMATKILRGHWLMNEFCHNIVKVVWIHWAITSWIHSYYDNVMTKFMINNRTDTWKTDINLLTRVQKVVIECNTEVAMETKRWSDFVECIINEKIVWTCFRKVLKVLKLLLPMAFAILKTFRTSLVPINHEMHSCSYLYDFPYL